LSDAPGLLHNMSAPPMTTIHHQAGPGQLLGTRRAFALPAIEGPLTPESLLALLDGRAWPGDAEAELRARLDAHAANLALPACAPVVAQAGPKDAVCTDLLDVLTVLAKSSAHVYLRDKAPNLGALRPGRRVVLLLPPERSAP
jgi:hypothetical protein